MSDSSANQTSVASAPKSPSVHVRAVSAFGWLVQTKRRGWVALAQSALRRGDDQRNLATSYRPPPW